MDRLARRQGPSRHGELGQTKLLCQFQGPISSWRLRRGGDPDPQEALGAWFFKRALHEVAGSKPILDISLQQSPLKGVFQHDKFKGGVGVTWKTKLQRLSFVMFVLGCIAMAGGSDYVENFMVTAAGILNQYQP